MMQSHKPILKISGISVKSGTHQYLEIPVARLPTQTMLSLPVSAINGINSGPRLWLSAAIHGDELNGVEIIRQVLARINPKKLSGVLIAVPIVNVFGFIEQSRYLPDRRDLNRVFPGSARGSLGSRIAHLFMKEVVSQCTHGIDLHTASNHRINLPQIRADLKDVDTHRCASAFGAPVIIHSATRDGSLRQAAANQGNTILLYEAGEALRFEREAIRVGVEGILRVMSLLGMYDSNIDESPLSPVEITRSKWIRASRSGIFHTEVELGQIVKKTQRIGFISDAFGGKNTRINASLDGLVIGYTQNPLVNRGDALFHLAEMSTEMQNLNDVCS